MTPFVPTHSLAQQADAEAKSIKLNGSPRAVVQAELGQLTMLGQDWSEWDETYAYMVSRDPVYLAANLNVRTFETLGVDLVALYNADKQPQAAFAYHGGQLVTQTTAQLAPLTDYLVR
ncbi:CHASE4 domain-containing protein [Aeromonas hydrophila]|uniref:CHASE4 domain-containing protein n=1 Tax=Aeromonas hydrophila TaxID=644 RepID=UPI0039C8B2D0